MDTHTRVRSTTLLSFVNVPCKTENFSWLGAQLFIRETAESCNLGIITFGPENSLLQRGTAGCELHLWSPPTRHH
jgi:hypothetical protein